jgi:hypothetical protein
MRKILFIVLITFLLINSYGAIDIKGYILNQKEQPIFDFIEISLNSDIQITGDSKFIFKNMNEGEYIFKINSPESKNHNPEYSSYENRFTITNEKGKLTFWNYSPKIVLTSGQKFNFKYLVKTVEGQLKNDLSVKLYNMQNNKYIETFSNLDTGNYRIIVNDPFSPIYNKKYDFSEPDNKRNQIELVIGTFNENVTVYSYTVWKNSNIKYTTSNKNIGSVIPLNFPGSPIIYNLEFEKVSPWIVKSWPINNQTMFSIRDKLKIIFSENIIFNQAIKNKILVYNSDKKEYIDVSVTYDTENRTIILTPKLLLDKTSQYILIVSNISDLNHNIMETDYKIGFYTETNDFEDFNHKYLVQNIQNVKLKDYVPPTQGGNETLVSTDIAFQDTNKLQNSRFNVVIKNPELVINIPQDKAYYSADFTPNYKVRDLDNFSVTMTLNDKEIPLNFKFFEEGKHTFISKLFDGENNELSTIQREFTLDKTKPVIKISPELSKTTYLKEFDGQITVSDQNIDSLDIFLNDIKKKNKINITENGEYELKVSAKDKSNNSVNNTYKIIIDSKKPMIVSKIETDSYYKIPFDQDLDIIDKNLDSSIVTINNNVIKGNKIELNSEGRFKLNATATDKCGNETKLFKIFELYTPKNYDERQKITSDYSKFKNLFDSLDKIEDKSGILYLERVLYALISNERKEAMGIKEFNSLKQEYNKIVLLTDKSKNIQYKQLLMLNKYWLFPKISSYLTKSKSVIAKSLNEFSYLPKKFNELYNIVNISQGQIMNLYPDRFSPKTKSKSKSKSNNRYSKNKKSKNESSKAKTTTPIETQKTKKINLDYFNMYYEDYHNNMLKLLEISKTIPALKIKVESILNNLYFGKKIANIIPQVSDDTLLNQELLAEIPEYYKKVLNSASTKDFSYLISSCKNLDFKKDLTSIKNSLRGLSDIRLLNYTYNIISKNYFVVSFKYKVRTENQNLEFWFQRDQKSQQFVIDHN